MDALVLAAMEKWPNVPDVYGWLRLDARAGWWLRQSRLTQPAICAFFDRNYACDAQGRYYVQNGPQRVFVALDRTPFIARREADGWRLVPTGARRRARAAWLTPEGEVMLDAEGVPALVDDRDLAGLVQEALAGWDGRTATLPPRLCLPEGEVPFALATHAALRARFGFDPSPAP